MTSALTERARAGDQDAFREVVEPHLPELHRHCYRMLGSLTDADDVLQEVLLAAWQGLASFAGRSSLRTWLYRIATTRCLNAIRAGQRQAPREPVPPFAPPEPSRRGAVTWLQPYPDPDIDRAVDVGQGPAARYQARESMELAFIAAAQRLPPRQMAALLLCDVLAFSTAEAAGMLETTSAAVKSALQRARASLQHQRAAGTAGASSRGTAAEQSLARRFADAFASDDVDAVVELLTDDAWLAMPPAPHEYYGRDAISAFLDASRRWRAGRRFQLSPTRANSHPAFGCYLSDGEGPASAIGLVVLVTCSDRITTVYRFHDPRLPVRFGLPAVLR